MELREPILIAALFIVPWLLGNYLCSIGSSKAKIGTPDFWAFCLVIALWISIRFGMIGAG